MIELFLGYYFLTALVATGMIVSPNSKMGGKVSLFWLVILSPVVVPIIIGATISEIAEDL